MLLFIPIGSIIHKDSNVIFGYLAYSGQVSEVRPSVRPSVRQLGLVAAAAAAGDHGVGGERDRNCDFCEGRNERGRERFGGGERERERERERES